MSASQKDLDNMTMDEALNYLETKICTHQLGIKFCKKMIERYR